MHAAQQSRHTTRPGMTLIEILVVMVIVIGMFGVSFAVVGLLTFSKLNESAARLATTIEHIFGRSAINGQRYRLVLDLDENAYWAECSEENVPLPEEMASGSLDEREEQRRRSRYDEDDEEADPFGIALDNMFDDCSEDLIPRHELGDDVAIDSVMTTHQRDPVTEGEATIEFFPDGFVEPSMIWVRRGDDPDGPVVTLTVEGMTGRVRVVTERLDIPDDFLEVEEDR